MINWLIFESPTLKYSWRVDIQIFQKESLYISSNSLKQCHEKKLVQNLLIQVDIYLAITTLI